MNSSDYHFFWKQTKLSQWAKTPFTDGVLTFKTAEHFMMHEKALLFGDKETAELILQTDSPKEAKRLGGIAKGFNQKTWDHYKFAIVVNGNVLKFLQNKEAQEELLSTGELILVEACPYDRIWGIGMTVDNPKISDESLWGENLLGKALVRVRNHIRKLNQDLPLS